MKWFQGEISDAIKKAIGEKKLFVVFVKGDNEESVRVEEQLNNDEISGMCTDDNSVVINIQAESIAGQQFASIYPILCVPSTYLINNDGMPSDIIPSLVTDEELTKRLTDGLQKFQSSVATPVQPTPPPETAVESPSTSNESMSQNSPPDQQVETSGINAKEKAEKLLEKTRIQKAEKEKKEQTEKENKRRDEGRELSQAKRDMAERQTKQLADEIAKRRTDDKAARERVKAQIKQDREDKLNKYEAEKKGREQEKEKKLKERELAQQTAKPKVDSNISRLQFRLPNGSTSTKQFPADAKFLIVSDYVTKELVTDYPFLRMTTTFPKREYTSEDCLKSLRELGLTPNASIIVSPGKSPSSSSSSLNPLSIIMLVLAPIISLFNWIISLFTGSGVSSSSSTQPGGSSSTTNTEDDASIARSADLRRRNIGNANKPRSNIRRLYDDEPDDDENATWNGNSTQQM